MNELLRRILQATDEMYSDTGVRPEPGYFQVHVHPEDWYQAVKESIRTMPIHGYPNQFNGFGIIQDASVAIGHPVVKCIWERVL